VTRRATILTVLLVALLAVLTVVAHGHLRRQRDRAGRAAADLAACDRMARQIRAVRGGPNLAAGGEAALAEVNALVERAARDAGIRSGGLVRIMHEPAQRLGETVYKEKPTQIILGKVTLKQAVELMAGIERAARPMDVRGLRLAAARPEQPTDAWNAEVTATVVIYDPPHDENRRNGP
jgi:hypothetical protein